MLCDPSSVGVPYLALPWLMNGVWHSQLPVGTIVPRDGWRKVLLWCHQRRSDLADIGRLIRPHVSLDNALVVLLSVYLMRLQLYVRPTVKLPLLGVKLMHVVSCQVAEHSFLELRRCVGPHPVDRAGVDLLVDELLNATLETLLDRVELQVGQVSHVLLAAVEIIELGHHELENLVPPCVFVLYVVLRAGFVKWWFVVTRLGGHICDACQDARLSGRFLLQEFMHNRPVVARLPCLACLWVLPWRLDRTQLVSEDTSVEVFWRLLILVAGRLGKLRGFPLMHRLDRYLMTDH